MHVTVLCVSCLIMSMTLKEIGEALGRLSNPTTHEKRRLVELLLAQSEYDALTTMSHWGGR